jgi:hypothetical protein
VRGRRTADCGEGDNGFKLPNPPSPHTTHRPARRPVRPANIEQRARREGSSAVSDDCFGGRQDFVAEARVRLENPLGYGNFLSGLKLSGERDGGLGLARFSAVCPLGGHMYANGLLWHADMAGAACCMYGPNYVKLSRVVAVQLLSMFSKHNAAQPPCVVPQPSAMQPCHHRLHSPRPHPCPATPTYPLLATKTSAVAAMTCPDYLHPHTRTMYPSTASAIYLYASSQRILGVAPSPLAPDPRPHTATHTARDSNLDSGNHDMSRLSTPAYLTDAPIHGLTDIPLRLLSTDIGCGTLAPVALAETRQHTLLATQTSAVATKTCLDYLHLHT